MIKKIMFSLMVLSCALPLRAVITFRHDTAKNYIFKVSTKGGNAKSCLLAGGELKFSLLEVSEGFSLTMLGFLKATIPSGFVKEDGVVFLVKITPDYKKISITNESSNESWLFDCGDDGKVGEITGCWAAEPDDEDSSDSSSSDDNYGEFNGEVAAGDGMLMYPF
ncbi:hypothetical protein K2X40_01380 [Candidatus Babeliales bacterium]|nr:hypothetical protein [Candidatus Babeliales bacterium]